ncbi:MAG: hypothetical protein WCN95_15900, partial [bacterium]
MKIMHFVPAFCVALILSAGSLSAQSKAFGVTLTPAQQEQFKAMNVAAEPSKKAIRENTTLSEDEKRTQMKAVYDGIKEKLKAILTPEQLKEMAVAPVRGASSRPQSRAFGVTLTPAQQEQFTAMNVAAEPSKKAIRENTTLSEDEKRTQMKAVYDGIKEKLKTILTPEQLKEMEAAPAHGTSSRPQSKAFGVTLTPAQQEQFKAMNVAAEPSKKAIRENTTLSEDEKRTQMKAV